MPDQYEAVRSLSFPVVAGALGVDMSKYKTRKAGREYYGPCPIHGPKNNTTSFSYNADGRFQCFSCNAKGRGAIDLVKAARSLGFQQAVEFLAPLATSTQAKEKAPLRGNSETTEETAEFRPLENDTWRKFSVPCQWLDARIPDNAIQERYGVFCYNNPARKSAYSGRVMIPVKDVEGRLFGYLGRLIPGEHQTESALDVQEPSPKYLFPKNLPKSRFLFGAHELRQHLSGLGTGRSVYQHIYLVESPFCVLKFASLGFPAVSPFGWSVSAEQIEIMVSLTKGVVALPDRNKYQQAAALAQSLAQRLWLRFPPLPDGVEDPEELDREQILALTR